MTSANQTTHTTRVDTKYLALLEKIAKLSTELCIAVDREAEDIGGSRPSVTIIQELGPLTDKWENT